jgi:hypothetical protein
MGDCSMMMRTLLLYMLHSSQYLKLFLGKCWGPQPGEAVDDDFLTSPGRRQRKAMKHEGDDQEEPHELQCYGMIPSKYQNT